MQVESPAPWDKDRSKTVKHGNEVLRALVEGHRYEITLPGKAPFAGVLAQLWTSGHVCAQFLLDDDDILELGAEHYIDNLTDMGEAEALQRVKDRVLRACCKYSEFDKWLAFNEASGVYMGHAVFEKAWDALVNEGAFRPSDLEGYVRLAKGEMK